METIELSLTKPRFVLAMPQSLWVDPATYLPVRTVSHLGGQTIQTDYRWLPPTAANVAHTYLTVPHGFREVTGPPMAAAPGSRGRAR